MPTDRATANRKTARRLLGVAVAMFGFGFALAPFYSAFCDALGLDRARSELAPEAGPKQNLRLELDTNSADLPVRFTPGQRVVVAQARQVLQLEFVLENLSSQPLRLQAIPSYAPLRAAAVLQKVQCFCMDEIKLAAGERKKLRVVLAVAAALPEALNAATLSYSLQRAG